MGCAKSFEKNWRPPSLLNVDVKLISKVLSNQIKNLLSNLTSSNQSAYVINRFISGGSISISDILEMTEILNIECYFFPIDIEKAFCSIDHYFLLANLEKYGFQTEF